MIKQYHLPEDDYVEVMTLALKQLGLYDQVRFLRKPTKSGCKLTNLIIWQAIWKFWHNNSVESINTKQIVKLTVTDKPHIQTNLEFVSTMQDFSLLGGWRWSPPTSQKFVHCTPSRLPTTLPNFWPPIAPPLNNNFQVINQLKQYF